MATEAGETRSVGQAESMRAGQPQSSESSRSNAENHLDGVLDLNAHAQMQDVITKAGMKKRAQVRPSSTVFSPTSGVSSTVSNEDAKTLALNKAAGEAKTEFNNVVEQSTFPVAKPSQESLSATTILGDSSIVSTASSGDNRKAIASPSTTVAKMTSSPKQQSQPQQEQEQEEHN